MSDLIKREDAIEAVASADATDGTVKVFTGRQINGILSALPSANYATEKTNDATKPSNDVINREDAIEIIDKMICDNKWVCECAINSLPTSDDVLKFHEDGTLEVKVPNAVKVGRVLVIDEVSSIGGGLYYPESDDDNWIPVSERLPSKEEKNYWVFLDNGNQCECKWTNDVFGLGANEWSKWGWSYSRPSHTKVIAWKPLPKPYRKESEVGE